MNNKPQRIKFVNDVKAHLLEIGATVKSENERWSEYTLGTCTISLRDESDHKQVYSIFTRFEECNHLSGSMNPKYNYHGIDGENGLCGWKEHLNSIKNFFN